MLTGITGYAYKASKATDFVSIAFLAIYVIIVIIYIVATIFCRQSFWSWTTIEELLLLAKNPTSSQERDRPNAKEGTTSTESDSSLGNSCSRAGERRNPLQTCRLDSLAHTSSGIRSLSTMGLSMKIKVDTRQGEEDLQLVFTDHEVTTLEPVRPDNPY